MRIIDWLFGRRERTPEPPLSVEGEASPPPARADSPTTASGNPGRATEGRVAFETGEWTWAETFDVIETTTRVLGANGHDVVRSPRSVLVTASGFELLPQVVDVTLLEDGGVQTLTTVEVRHPQLVPDGLFEYQHSTGDTLEGSLTKGIESWVALDLPVLLDALRDEPTACSIWKMAFPATADRPARVRRAVLGHVAYYSPKGGNDSDLGEDEHAFCNCCFLTRNIEAFKSLVEGEGTFGVRFYAARGDDGTPRADCRINGEDYGPGMEALRAYVATWPGTGFAFRKQYVLIHTPTRST